MRVQDPRRLGERALIARLERAATAGGRES